MEFLECIFRVITIYVGRCELAKFCQQYIDNILCDVSMKYSEN
jgi:hypothetical protein